MNLALFDFDGTISNKDSLADFIIYMLGKPRYYSGLVLLSPMLIAWKLKLICSDSAKVRLLTHFFKGWDEPDFKKGAYDYSTKRLDKIIRPQARKKIIWHKNQGDEVVVVSASMKCWLKGWCQQQGIQLIATELVFKHKKLTGQMHTPNCQGQEKVRRILEKYNLQKFEQIYAYGDSSGDKEMLSLAHKTYYKSFQ